MFLYPALYVWMQKVPWTRWELYFLHFCYFEDTLVVDALYAGLQTDKTGSGRGADPKLRREE